MEVHFSRTNGELDELIDDIIRTAGVNHPGIVREMLISALKAGQETDYLADLKLMRTTMKEMRYTNKIFGTYRDRKKVTIFGSARTQPDGRSEKASPSPAAGRARLHDHYGRRRYQYAGRQRGCRAGQLFAVNIRLPFEQGDQSVMMESKTSSPTMFFFPQGSLPQGGASGGALGGFGTWTRRWSL
jgi:hypothetical protein